MKTSSVKTLAFLTISAGWFVTSSFSGIKNNTENLSVFGNWEEYSKVQSFAYENICKPFSDNLKGSRNSDPAKMFSRCPSGYMPQITTVEDSVKTDRFVNGRIFFHKGCEPKEICYFKICVAKKFAMVRSKESTEYMSVNDWIKLKSGKSERIAKN
jgi:hypothetical protein